MAELGRLGLLSRLPREKSDGASRPAAVDPKRPFNEGEANDDRVDQKLYEDEAYD